MKTVKCVVSCFDSNGVPTFFPCIIECTKEEYSEGEHYEMARNEAIDARYENPKIVYDENDGPEFLFNRFTW